MTDTDWYFSVGDGQRRGPVSLERLREAIASGQLKQDHLVWHESLGDWQHVASVPGLQNAASPAKTPPPIRRRSQVVRTSPANPTRSTNGFVGDDGARVESVDADAITPGSAGTKADAWGGVTSVAGALSGGLLLVGLCFAPMACFAVPVSIGGIVSALFCVDKRLRMIGIIGNSIVLFFSLGIVIYIAIGMSMALQPLNRY